MFAYWIPAFAGMTDRAGFQSVPVLLQRSHNRGVVIVHFGRFGETFE